MPINKFTIDTQGTYVYTRPLVSHVFTVHRYWWFLPVRQAGLWTALYSLSVCKLSRYHIGVINKQVSNTSLCDIWILKALITDTNELRKPTVQIFIIVFDNILQQYWYIHWGTAIMMKQIRYHLDIDVPIQLFSLTVWL